MNYHTYGGVVSLKRVDEEQSGMYLCMLLSMGGILKRERVYAY